MNHLQALLFGSPFDKQILVEQTPGLGPDAGISSGRRLHASCESHPDDLWTRCCLLNAALS